MMNPDLYGLDRHIEEFETTKLKDIDSNIWVLFSGHHPNYYVKRTNIKPNIKDMKIIDVSFSGYIEL